MDQLAELGFQLILYPLAALFSAGQAIEAIYRKLHSDGTTLGAEDRLMAFDQLNDVIGVNEKIALAERFGAD